MPRIIASIIALVCIGESATAQGITVYPTTLYRGENVITVSNRAGIERVVINSTRYIDAESSTGFLSDCPMTVDIEALVASVTTGETLDLTIYGCDGSQTNRSLTTERWTILHEYTGNVPLTSDTCLSCRISGARNRWLVDIEVKHPDLRVDIPSIAIDSGYWLGPGVDFRYNVCYSPSELGSGTDTIILRFLRNQPNGGLEEWTIAKPITWAGVPAPEIAVVDTTPELPPLVDPTGHRNIVMPSAVAMKQGSWFYGNYLFVGHLFGYGATDRLTLLAGGSVIPDFIERFYLGTIGAKYEVVRSGDFSAAAGFQVAFSSVTDSDIRTIAPYGLASYGNDQHRVTLGISYGFKRHVIPVETFDRNALVLAAGFNTEISRGWKIGAELISIESSGIAPLLVTGRHFGESWAIDFGLGVDLAADNVLFFNDAVSGEIEEISIIPYLSGMWMF